ncbi:P-loop containing nucleoside triphosphate hydrolase protein [Lojkania enalia]|uniref:small monomeric GTPase n=1 Tax=Lojkania enalia TaxID=147567 RepID=A0A9P4K2Y1_9PLEO|nr:P-loop containing nucleoside triphosphate hydrolase protein [Didymosphaeria enalia]
MAQGTSQSTKEIPLKLVVMGKRGVGKTALIKKLVDGEFIEAYNPTTEDRYSARRTLGVQAYAVEITDTGSEDTYGDGTIRDGEGFLLVYDVCDRSSLEEIRALYEEIRKAKVPVVEGSPTSTLPSSESPSVVVVGNKIDRLDKHRVTTEEGREASKDLNCGFGEATAKGSVEHVFYDVIQHCELSSSCNGIGDPSGTREEGMNDWLCGFSGLFSKIAG